VPRRPGRPGAVVAAVLADVSGDSPAAPGRSACSGTARTLRVFWHRGASGMAVMTRSTSRTIPRGTPSRSRRTMTGQRTQYGRLPGCTARGWSCASTFDRCNRCHPASSVRSRLIPWMTHRSLWTTRRAARSGVTGPLLRTVSSRLRTAAGPGSREPGPGPGSTRGSASGSGAPGTRRTERHRRPVQGLAAATAPRPRPRGRCGRPGLPRTGHGRPQRGNAKGPGHLGCPGPCRRSAFSRPGQWAWSPRECSKIRPSRPSTATGTARPRIHQPMASAVNARAQPVPSSRGHQLHGEK
jgi:hypothetical protein